MCGRFTYRYTWSEIHALYRLTTPPANLQPRYNICPTTPISTVVARDGKNEMVPMRWGLIPSWWKKKEKETPANLQPRYMPALIRWPTSRCSDRLSSAPDA
jgi:putative SOS response-associated peptidase YedK